MNKAGSNHTNNQFFPFWEIIPILGIADFKRIKSDKKPLFLTCLCL